MGTSKIRQMPCAYALWLRDTGSSEERIARVLGVSRPQLPEVLRLARCEIDRLRRSTKVPSIVAFVDESGDGVEAAADRARDAGGVLHLVTLHRTPRPRVFGNNNSALRKGAQIREHAEAMLERYADEAVANGVHDVVPHAMACSDNEALQIIAKTWGRVTVADREPVAPRRPARAMRWRIATS